jgi:hypothetical protein
MLKNSLRKAHFMSIGVLGDHGKIRLAFSPYVLKYFLIILQTSLNTFRIFGDDFEYCRQP